jgi:hypothetical protein
MAKKAETEYSKLLRDPRWQKLRLQIFERDDWACCKCGDTEKTLAVHHKRYIRDKKPWEYDPNDLMTLCEDCHQEEYELRPDCEAVLLEVLKIKGFFWHEVDMLASSLMGLKFTDHSPEVVLTAICWALRNVEMRHEIVTAYLKSLHETEAQDGRGLAEDPTRHPGQA